MNKKQFNFVLIDDHEGASERLESLKDFVVIRSLAEYLNACSQKSPIIIQSTDESFLDAIIPLERPYGWVLNSSSSAIYFYLTDLSQIDIVKDFSFNGIASDNLELLVHSQKKMETLFS